MTASGTVVAEERDCRLTLTLSQPGRRNAISVAMWRSLTEIAGSLHERRDIRSVVLRGDGAVFSAGADISDFDQARLGTGAADYDDLVETACQAIAAIPIPTIAAIRGLCIGAGTSLANSCDLRICADDAEFAVPAAKLGLGYDPRGIVRLARIFGATLAREMLFTGGRISAERAFQSGAVHAVHATGEFDAALDALAARIEANAPLTLRAAKIALRKIDRCTAPAIDAEADAAYRAADNSADYIEGRLAFREKRPPRFEGR